MQETALFLNTENSSTFAKIVRQMSVYEKNNLQVICFFIANDLQISLLLSILSLPPKEGV